MIHSLGTIMSSSVFGTVFSGVMVFVAGQLIAKRVIEPYVSFKEQLGIISALLLSEQDKLNNPLSPHEYAANIQDVAIREQTKTNYLQSKKELTKNIKNAAAQLMAKYSALSCCVKNFNLMGFRFVPSQSDILSAAQNLNLIAASIAGNDKCYLNSYIKEIGSYLSIPTTYSS